ncbi:MAG: sigma-54 dependent transcriptional regulator [Sedimenticola sp.]
MLHSGCILLLDADQDRVEYLRHIFDFLEFEFDVAKSFSDLRKKLQKQDDATCFSVIHGPDLSKGDRDKLVALVDQQDFKPALFRIAGNGEVVKEEQGESPYTGVLQLPVRYEALNQQLHKAQVYHEHQLAERGGLRPLELFRSLSGSSRATRHINQMIEQVANTDATVLVLGESGTGKEVVARKLHYNSARRGKAFVPVNCGAIPADLLESELFGHEKGAFTGAISTRQGRFELAEGGTLFLDEIGDMSMPMQVKLLRVLQERTFERVGSSKTMQCDVRIIAATHRNLEEAIKQEKFREDLFYRLNVFPIDMPPLRERTEDIPVLVNDLISRIEKEKRGSVRLTPGSVAALTQYNWPGNVRELANLIERLAILYPYGVVDIKDLPEKFRAGYTGALESLEESPRISIEGEESQQTANVSRLPHEGIDLKAHLSAMELDLIQQALDESDGVVAHAAKRLKMRRTTLVEKMRKYGLQRAQD